MTVTSRGSQPAERKTADPSQEQGTAVIGDALATSKRKTTGTVATGKSAVRGRLAERMAEIAQNAGLKPQTSASAPASAQLPLASQPTTTDQVNPTKAAATPPPAQQAAPAAGPKTKPKSKTAPKSNVPAPGSWIERLKAEHQSLLGTLHQRVLDATHEQLFFVPTKDPEALSSLTITSPNRAFGHDYRPVPCQVFDWALKQIPEDLSGFTFVDYGAGKGRAMLLAAEHPFAAVAGVEFAEELHDNAEMNIAQYPRSNMRCRNVECVLEDAVQVGPPEGSSVHYFFNPFERNVFAEVLKNIVIAYRTKPRRLYLILIDPIAIDLVDASGVFARVEPTQIEELKLKVLSPHTVAVYRSLA